MSRYCRVFSQHSPKKKTSQIKSAQPLFWRIYTDLAPRTMRLSTAPQDSQVKSNLHQIRNQVASTSGASPIQSCNLKGFKGSSDILVEKIRLNFPILNLLVCYFMWWLFERKTLTQPLSFIHSTYNPSIYLEIKTTNKILY